MTPKQVTEFREKYFPGENTYKSRLRMAVEFDTTERTLRAYESGELKSVPRVFARAMALWLEINCKDVSNEIMNMYYNDHRIHNFVDSFVDLIISFGYSPQDAVSVLKLCQNKYNNEIDGVNEAYKH